MTVGLGLGRVQVWPTSGCVVMDTANAEFKVTAVGKDFVALSEKVKVSVPFLRTTVFPGNRPVTLTLICAGPGAAGASLFPPPQAPRSSVRAATSPQTYPFLALDE